MNSVLLLLLCLAVLNGTGVQKSSCLPSLLIIFILAIVLVFVWEHKIFFGVTLILIIGSLYLISAIIDYIKYKDETPEQRKERIRMNKMIEDWKKRNNF